MIPRKLSFRKDAASELQKLWCLGILPFLPPPLSVFSQSGFNSGPSFPTTYTGLAHSFLFASSHLCFSLQLFPSGTFCHSLGLDSYPSLSITVSLPASPFLYLSLRRPSGTLLQSITIEAHRAPILPVLLPSLARFGPGSAHSGRECFRDCSYWYYLLPWGSQLFLGSPVTLWTCWWPSPDPRAAEGLWCLCHLEGGGTLQAPRATGAGWVGLGDLKGDRYFYPTSSSRHWWGSQPSLHICQ